MTTRLRSPMLHHRSPLTPVSMKAVSPPVHGLLTLKNFLFLLTLSISALVWSHQFGFLTALGLADGPLHAAPLSQHVSAPHHDFESGPVRVASLLPDESAPDPAVEPQPVSAHDALAPDVVDAQSAPTSDDDVAQTDDDAPAASADDSVSHDLAQDDKSVMPEPLSPHTNEPSDQHVDHAEKAESEASGDEPGDSTKDDTTIHGQAVPAPAAAEEPRSLREVLKFTPKTAINFMHFHKTGGVSFKTSIHKFYFGKLKGDGSKVMVRDACYAREGAALDGSKPTFQVWRCDWEPVRNQPEEQRNLLDFSIGHQFWGNGIGDLLNKRDLRSFTILRHPFDRKVSFYYHFFVRELGRKEEEVTFDEIRNFLLYDKLIMNAELGRDLGPNYMAGRLLSNGVDGYVGNSSFSYYDVPMDRRHEVAERALKLMQDYLFVGLQKESAASKCMLRKVLETFNEVNGIDNSGAEHVDKDAAVLNTGSYSLTAKEIWKRMSMEEREEFDRKERVDLLIYQEGERLFSKQVGLYGCAERVKNSKYLT